MSNLRYRLALDLGTTSLGWAVFRLDNAENNPDLPDYKLRPTALIKAGVRIFSDGRNPKDGSSLAVARREARAMRRRRDRLLKRKNRMMAQLLEFGFFPKDEAERKALELLKPYELRAKGLHAALSPAEFARALFHINQRRGFKSNRKTDKGASDAGALKSAINALRTEITEQGHGSVGALLWARMQAGEGVRARYREQRVEIEGGKSKINKSYDLYIDRAMIEQEFDAIWTQQAALNPTQFHEKARFALKDTLLFQRNLRPVKPGRCTLMPEEERAPLALPSQQRFRIYQEVNNLRLLGDRLQENAISLEQRNAIVAELECKNKFSFTAMRKLLKLGGDVQFNLEDAKRTELKGNTTSATLAKKELLGQAWYALAPEKQDEIVLKLLQEEGEGTLIAWLQSQLGIDETLAEKLANTSLPEGYGSLSRAALAKILPELQKTDLTYDKAVQAAGFSHHSKLGFDFDFDDAEIDKIIDSDTGEITPLFKELPYYGKPLRRHVAFAKDKPRNDEERYGKIANPTVHIGLNQVRLVVNALIKKYGRPTEVVVELARDLKQSREQKLEEQKRQAENQKRNARIRENIANTLGISPERVRRADIQKWLLWEELSFDAVDRRCPYSGVQISAAMLLSDAVEIEHILPFSQTLDDSLNNKTVSMRQANRIKGNRTPWDARLDFEQQGWQYAEIESRANRMPKNKRYRFAADGYQQWLREDKGFLARALNDTRYLSRIAKSYLSVVCPANRVRVIPGQMTAMLRRTLGLNDVLGPNGEKNRNDHRHHAVDACVIGITDQGMLQRFAQASAQARQKGLDRLVESIAEPWPSYRLHVERAIGNIWVSHKPDHAYQGAMMEETSYGLAKDGSIKQKRKADGSVGREITNLIKISEPQQGQRHGLDAAGQALPYKGYVGGSNYCIEITRNETGKWEGEVISTFRAYNIVRQQGLAQLRHPKQGQNGQALVMRLVIDDSVRLEIDGQESTMRLIKVGGNGQMFFAPIQEANVDARNRDKQDPFSYISKLAGSLKAAKGRRVIIGPAGELRDSGFSD